MRWSAPRRKPANLRAPVAARAPVTVPRGAASRAGVTPMLAYARGSRMIAMNSGADVPLSVSSSRNGWSALMVRGA